MDQYVCKKRVVKSLGLKGRLQESKMKSSSSGRNSVRCGESVLDEREKVEELPIDFSVDMRQEIEASVEP